LSFNCKSEISYPAEHIFYISPLPLVSFTVPEYACPGYETIVANGSKSRYGSTHHWTLSENADYSQLHDNDTSFIPHEIDYIGNWSVSSDFSFPHFPIRGPHSYTVSLTLSNRCGIAVMRDTVLVTLAAKIGYDTTTFYDTSIIILLNESSNFDSWQWTYSAKVDSVNTNLTDTLKQSTMYVLTVSDSACTDRDTVELVVNLYANAGPDRFICQGDSVQIGNSGMTLPSGWSSLWSPSAHLSSRSILNPKAAPLGTTTYTLWVCDGSNDTIEYDEVTVYVDTIPEPEFSIEEMDTMYYCFSNLTEPYSISTKYRWLFSDGDSTDDVNPCHQFPLTGVDTFFVISLTAYNLCDTVTYTDTMWFDSTNQILTFEDTFSNEFLINSIAKLDIEKIIIKAYPNPFSAEVNLEFSVPATTTVRFEIYNLAGAKVSEISSKTFSQGKHKVKFDGGSLSPGSYLCKAYFNGEVKVIRLTVNR